MLTRKSCFTLFVYYQKIWNFEIRVDEMNNQPETVDVNHLPCNLVSYRGLKGSDKSRLPLYRSVRHIQCGLCFFDHSNFSSLDFTASANRQSGQTRQPQTLNLWDCRFLFMLLCSSMNILYNTLIVHSAVVC